MYLSMGLLLCVSFLCNVSQHGHSIVRGVFKKGQMGLIIKKTRQQLYEECGITVKTLNRTIKKLEEDRVISVEKGKITINLEEYKRAREMVHHYISY